VVLPSRFVPQIQGGQLQGGLVQVAVTHFNFNSNIKEGSLLEPQINSVETCASLVDNLATGETLAHCSNSKDSSVEPVEAAPQLQYQINDDPEITDKSFLYVNNCYTEEFEQKYEIDSEIGKVFVKGRLRKNIHFWESIGASNWVLSVIRTGYKIPFISTPEVSYSNNNRSAIEEREFVSDSIKLLIENGSVEEVSEIPHVVNPLSVAKRPSGKLRLILDLRYVNRHIFKEKIKFEDWTCFESYINLKGFLYKFDLKQGYHHI